MTTQVLNFMWLNLALPAPPDPAEGGVREPMPAHYLRKLNKAAAAHPGADVRLWVDSQRLTPRQMEYLKSETEGGASNMTVCDLRRLPEYDGNPLYNENADEKHWRNLNQDSIIWRQVDAAKILVSLQGDYDQTFFVDLDHAHLDIDSADVQNRLGRQGIFFGSAAEDFLSVENQLWGFEKSHRPFFESYYTQALEAADCGNNAWDTLKWKIALELVNREGVTLKDLLLPIADDGTEASHPLKTVFRDSADGRAPSLPAKAVQLGKSLLKIKNIF